MSEAIHPLSTEFAAQANIKADEYKTMYEWLVT